MKDEINLNVVYRQMILSAANDGNFAFSQFLREAYFGSFLEDCGLKVGRRHNRVDQWLYEKSLGNECEDTEDLVL